MNADEAHRRAEALFKKEKQLREGQQAMAEYQAGLRAMRSSQPDAPQLWRASWANLSFSRAAPSRVPSALCCPNLP